MSINTFSYPTKNLSYPAITVCRKIPYNPDEYVRAVFDNFQLTCRSYNSCKENCDASCQETERLRNDFRDYITLNTVRILHHCIVNSLVSIEYNYFQTNDHKSIKSRLKLQIIQIRLKIQN